MFLLVSLCWDTAQDKLLFVAVIVEIVKVVVVEVFDEYVISQSALHHIQATDRASGLESPFLRQGEETAFKTRLSEEADFFLL